MMLASVLFALACALPMANAGLLSSTYDGDDLVALCANKTINLSRMAHLDMLIEKLDDDIGGECLENTEAALRDLKQVVDSNSHRECTMGAYERYRDFYLRYLDTSDKEKMKTFVKLPRSLRQFALAYGIQLGGMCRTMMVRKLLDDGGKLVNEEDFEQVRELIEPNGPMASALGYTGSRPDEIMLPSDFMAIYEASVHAQKTPGKIGLKIRTTPLVKRVQTMCERRFKPVYVPLMMPVAQFTNLGFDYRKGVLKEAIEEAAQNELTRDSIGRWSRVVFMCEIMTKIELVESVEDHERAEGNDATQVRVRTKDEMSNKSSGGRAEGRKDKHNASNDAGDGDDDDDHDHDYMDLLNETDANIDDIKQVVYNPVLSVDLPDVILGTAGQKNAVSKINTNMDELARIKARFVTKLARKIIKDLTRYRHIKLIKFMLKEIKGQIDLIRDERKAKKKPRSVGEVQTNLVQALNHIVDSEMNPDRAVRESDDSRFNFLGWCLAGSMLLVILIIVIDCQTLYSTLFGPAG